MSSTDVQILKTVDNIKTAIELGQSQNLAADVAKLTAMLAAGVAAESAFRTYSALNGLGKALSDWRLGKAVSGREIDIAKAQALAGLVAAELVGRGIDYINEPLAKVRNPNFEAATVARWGRFFVAGGAIFVARLA